jgi:hypothetical protein
MAMEKSGAGRRTNPGKGQPTSENIIPNRTRFDSQNWRELRIKARPSKLKPARAGLRSGFSQVSPRLAQKMNEDPLYGLLTPSI